MRHCELEVFFINTFNFLSETKNTKTASAVC